MKILLPAGVITPYAGSSAPTNWLMCDGSAVNRTTYASLFAIVSTDYGVGDGSTTFNLPDLRGKAPVGVDSSQSEFNVLGETGGAKTVNLQHSHTVNSHTHGTAATTTGINNSNHTHSSIVRGGQTSDGQSADHTHNYSITNGAAAPGTDNALSTAQSVLQPYIAINYIIKT